MSDKKVTRVLEITRCGDCPHLDARWERAPWSCDEGALDIRSKNCIHPDCPLTTKAEYLREKT